MTEDEWLACHDPQRMLVFMRGKASERKLRLFVVACCRRVTHLMSDRRSRYAVEVAERHADGLAPDRVMGDALWDANRACDHLAEEVAVAWSPEVWAAEAAAKAACGACDHWKTLMDPQRCRAFHWAACASGGPESALAPGGVARSEGRAAEQAEQCRLLRDLFVPFRGARPLPSAWRAWNERAAPSIAQAVYDERAFDRLPVLGDALEEAGCTDDAILSHLRSPGPHNRGCWAVDLVLGKS